MEGGRKRKIAAQLGACRECHRLHRACDGERPCLRCIKTGKASACRSIRRNPYKRTEWINQNIPNGEPYNSPNSTQPTVPAAFATRGPWSSAETDYATSREDSHASTTAPRQKPTTGFPHLRPMQLPSDTPLFARTNAFRR